MKRFEVRKVELMETEDGVKYYGIFDKNGNDWYEFQIQFNDNTLKVLYNKDNLQILGFNTDVSMIAPTTVGDIVEEIEYQKIEWNYDLYLVNGKVIKLKDCEKIENGKILFFRENKIEKIKEELNNLKNNKIKRGVEVKKGIFHPIRDTDKINLMVAKNNWIRNIEWKFFDENGEGVKDEMTLEIIDKLFLNGAKLLNGAIMGELEAVKNLENLSDKELKNLDIKEYFEKYYKMLGGI